MKSLLMLLALAAIATALTGCSVTTKMVTRERVDQDLTGTSGNRGYLVGTPPAVGERKPTKTYIEVQVEAPAIEKENRVPRKTEEVAAAASAPETNFEAALSQPVTEKTEAREELRDYKVQKDETLQKISMKLFGTTKKWKKIYNLNKEVLKSPDKLRPGMVIKVPKSESEKPKGNEYTK